MRTLAGFCALILAGCSQGPVAGRPDDIVEVDAVRNEAPANAPQSLVGEWRVAGVDGEAIDLPHAITLSIGDNRIDLDSGCIAWAWSYAYSAGRLTTRNEPRTTCLRNAYDAERRVGDAFAEGGLVASTPQNGIEIRGNAHSVTLFSQ